MGGFLGGEGVHRKKWGIVGEDSQSLSGEEGGVEEVNRDIHEFFT